MKLSPLLVKQHPSNHWEGATFKCPYQKSDIYQKAQTNTSDIDNFFPEYWNLSQIISESYYVFEGSS